MSLNQEDFKSKYIVSSRTATFGNKIIFVGGYDDRELYFDYHTFNTTTKQWTECPTENTPQPKIHFSLALDGRLFLKIRGCKETLRVWRVQRF